MQNPDLLIPIPLLLLIVWIVLCLARKPFHRSMGSLGHIIYNAMRLANVAVTKGDEVSVFMLGKGVLYEKSSDHQFNVIEQVNQFEGDFYV